MGVTPLLYVIDYFRDPHAGTEGQLCALVEGLDGSEFAPHLLVFEDSPWLREKGFPCEYTVLGHRSLASPATWLALARLAGRAIALPTCFSMTLRLSARPCSGCSAFIHCCHAGIWGTGIRRQ